MLIEPRKSRYFILWNTKYNIQNFWKGHYIHGEEIAWLYKWNYRYGHDNNALAYNAFIGLVINNSFYILFTPEYEW